jgi:hypothetical protein
MIKTFIRKEREVFWICKPAGSFPPVFFAYQPTDEKSGPDQSAGAAVALWEISAHRLW